MPASELIFLEVFAGRATLTAEVRKSLHLQCIAIDHKVKQPRAKITVLDLTRASDQEIFFNLCMHANVAAAHFAPVCGTASKARERPMPPGYKGKPLAPLRSYDQLLGLDSLAGQDRDRVHAANILYAVTVVAAILLISRNTIVSIENPKNSYFWAIACLIAALLENGKLWTNLEDVNFANCMFGSKRKKHTTWKSTPAVFHAMNKECDSSHVHESWTLHIGPNGQVLKMPTAEEAAYTPELAKAVATCLGPVLLDRGVMFPTDLSAAANPRKVVRAEQFRLPQLISEFFAITDFPVPTCDSKQIPLPIVLEQGGDLKPDQVHWELESLQQQPHTMRAFKNKPEPGEMVFGLFRSPKNFVVCAESLMHPIDFSCPLPDELVLTLSQVLQLGPAGLIAHRAERAKELLCLVKSMEADNSAYLNALPATPKKILRNKRMALWKHLSLKFDCPDAGIVDEIAQGCPLTGIGAHSSLFPAGFQPAQKPADQLKKQHLWLRHQVVGRCRSSGDSAVDQECWEQTLSEVTDGWMEGPFDDEEAVTAHIGSSDWLCSRRFPLVQGEKVRLIDDAKESQLNTAYYATNKLVLQDVDCLVSLIMQMCRCFVRRGEFAMRLSDGSTVSGRVASDWGSEVGFLGRTLDLSSAYKQLPTSDLEPWSRIIVVHCPIENKPKFFVSLVLPFGCTASVYFFNRASKNLWWLFQKMVMVIGTTYYDDYPTVEPEQTAASARTCQELLLTSLGWKFAKEGKKALEFASSFDVLGISLDLSYCSRGSFALNNKASRIEKILTQVDAFVTKGCLTQAEAAQVHGILNFAQGQYLGRV